MTAMDLRDFDFNFEESFIAFTLQKTSVKTCIMENFIFCAAS